VLSIRGTNTRRQTAIKRRQLEQGKPMQHVYPIPDFIADRCFINNDQYLAMYER
jgi:hypothetical protein